MKKCQFLIGNVYRNPDMSMHGKRQKRVNSLQVMYITFYKVIVKEIFPKMEVCQFLIGNVYHETRFGKDYYILSMQ